MSKVVLDTSAVLAHLFDQTGAEKVAPILESGAAVISSANYAETVSKLFDLKSHQKPFRQPWTTSKWNVLHYLNN